MYRLYWDRGSANMAPHAVLREIGTPFELIRIDVERGENHRPEYLALNPNHRVPTLVDGLKTLYESAAIVLYLCERHPEAGLMPVPGDGQRHLFLQWLVYLTNTVQENLQHWSHADNFVDQTSSRNDMKTVAERKLDEMFSRLDSTLAANGPYFLGKQFSAVDIFFTMLCRWTRKMPKSALGYPHVRALVEKVTARPAWVQMMEAEGIDWNGPLQ